MNFKQAIDKHTSSVLVVGLLGLGMAMISTAFAIDLAKVNDKVITDKDVVASLSSLNEGQRKAYLQDVNNRRELVNRLIDQNLLVSEAEKAKIDQTGDYKEAMETFRKQFLANKYLENKLAAQVTEKSLKKYFEAHKSHYSTDQVQVQHILASDEKTAKELLKKAKDKYADFQEIAEKESKDPSAKNNRGDLGMINWETPLVPEFKEAAFRGKKGDIVGPVKTSFGYHLIKIVDKKVGKTLEYHEVELRVRNDYQAELVQTAVVNLKAAAKVSIDETALAKEIK